jgi:ligand-binding sensor domain-containing protein
MPFIDLHLKSDFIPTVMKYFFTLLIVSVTSLAFSQVGNYYLSHYSNDGQSGSLSFDIAQDPNGLMYFATRTGIKQFDGRNWHPVAGNSVMYTISLTPDGRVLAGGEGLIAEIATAADFTLGYQPLLSEPGTDFFESVSTASGVVFASEQKLVRIDVKTKKAETLPLPDGEEGFATVFELYTVPYASTFDGSIYKVEGNTLRETDLKTGSPVAFTAGHEDRYFVVTEEQQFFLFDANKGLTKVALQDATYLRSGVIVNGTWVNPRLIALGTLNGGVVFIDPVTGKTEEIVNYYSGLPDNEVYCLKRDAEGNVWAGHEYGFSCISPVLPFRSFNHYTGLSGNILCAKTVSGRVYVGTSVGLFVLEKQDQYGEEIYYVEKKGTKSTAAAPAAEPAQESKKRGFLRFRKKKDEEPATNAKATVAQTVTKVRQTRKILLGTTYAYKKVQGIESKVERLITHNNKLYAAGLAGLYQIESNKALALVQEPVEVVATTKQHGIVGETYRSRVFMWNGNTQTTLIEDIRDDLSAIVEDEDGVLWIAGTKTMYKMDKNATVESFPFTNPALDRTEGMILQGQALFVNSNGFYTVSHGAVRAIDSLGKPTQFFATGSNLWYRHQETWRCLGSFADHENLEYLNVFGDLRYIEAEEQSEALWIATKDNELFRFYSNRLVPKSADYPLLVRSVRNQSKFFTPGQQAYKVEQHEGQLTFEVVQATFGSQHGAQYRFLLEGMPESDWSAWTTDNQFKFPYLPLGSYLLKMQTRDILGRIKELKPIRLKIDPPFWKTPWFYAMEFAFFSVLVIISIRLQAMNSRYRAMAEWMSMLTIIMLITLLQAAFSTYFVTLSPVVDFAFQVGLAFLVLPVEIFLRKAIFSKDEKNKLYQFINPSLKKPTNPG